MTILTSNSLLTEGEEETSYYLNGDLLTGRLTACFLSGRRRLTGAFLTVLLLLFFPVPV